MDASKYHCHVFILDYWPQGYELKMQHSPHKSANLVCGIDFSRLSKSAQFISLSSSVLGLFIIYGYIQVRYVTPSFSAFYIKIFQRRSRYQFLHIRTFQEKIFHIPGFRAHGWYLSFIQFTFVSVISYIDSSLLSKSVKRREM